MSAIRKHANGQSCIRCGRNDRTTVLAHYSGPWQHRFGKGRSIKGHDIAAAELCARCHKYFDEYESGNTIERSDEFLAMCLLTNIRRVKA